MVHHDNMTNPSNGRPHSSTSWTSKLLDITKFPFSDGAILADSRDCKIVRLQSSDSASSVETQTIKLIPQTRWERIKCAFNKITSKRLLPPDCHKAKTNDERSFKDSIRNFLLKPLRQKRNDKYFRSTTGNFVRIPELQKLRVKVENMVEPFDVSNLYRLEDDLLLEDFHHEEIKEDDSHSNLNGHKQKYHKQKHF